MRTKKLNSTIAMLKEYKESNQLTYQELAEQMNVNDKTLSAWIVGRACPSIKSLRKIELFFNTFDNGTLAKRFSDNIRYIDSRLVAEWTDKKHSELLKDIRGYINDLEKEKYNLQGVGEISPTPQKVGKYGVLDPKLYFIKSSYIHPQNKTEYPCYLVSELGCELIEHKMRNSKGTIFTALYINEFHRMKDNEQAKVIDHDRKPAPRLEDDPTFSREAVERRLANMTPEQRDLNYIRNKLIEVSKTDDIRAITPKLVRVAKLIDIILGTDSEARKLQ